MSTKSSHALARRSSAKPAKRPARPLLTDLREMILQARAGVAHAVDSGLVTLYWHVGRRIRQDILKEKRAEYGQKIVSALGTQLSAEFGRGFGVRNLFRMVRFAEVFPDEPIVSALRTLLGWTHFRQIIALDDPLKRDFYAEMCRMEKWNTRTLEKKIGSMLFERTALSKKPDKLIRRELAALRAEDRLTPDLVFRDPYVLDFLRLHDTYAEQDIEAAILREMESFILELGTGKRAQHVELLELEKSGIHVASYLTKVLPKKLLERKLHDAVRLARARLEAGKD